MLGHGNQHQRIKTVFWIQTLLRPGYIQNVHSTIVHMTVKHFCACWRGDYIIKDARLAIKIMIATYELNNYTLHLYKLIP